MIRVGIITLYYNNPNYGGVLQAYALRKVIEELGYDCKQISYDSYYQSIRRKISAVIKKEVKKIVYGKWYSRYLKRCNDIRQFALGIPHTKVVTDKNLSSLNDQFDVFVCGSDQIWNPIGWRPAYFLSFAEKTKRKVSYAASIARDSLDKNEAIFLAKHIKDFYAISVRETESVKLLKSIDDSIIVSTMPDPTLLVKKEEWARLAKGTDEEAPYIFAYFLGSNEMHMDMAIDYAKKRGLNIRFIDGLLFSNRKWEMDNEPYMKQGIDVPGFLFLIQNAQMVITDSFHAAVFAIVFEKPFVILNRFQEQDRLSMNSRTRNLMRMMNLNRIVDNLNAELDYHYTDIELKSIRAGIEYQREKGISFLTQSLKEV